MFAKIKNKKIQFTCLAIVGLCFTSLTEQPSARAGDFHLNHQSGFIQLTPFSSTPVDQVEMAKDIHMLFENSDTCQTSAADCVNPNDVIKVQAKANQFRKKMQDIVEAKLSDSSGGKIAYEDSWYTDGPLGMAAHEYHKITFQSLIQRPDGHPSNTVTLNYIVPARDKSCLADYKTTIVLAGATDDTIKGVSTLGNYISRLNYVATVFMYFPQFGVRRYFPSGKADPAGSHDRYDPQGFNVDFLDIDDGEATEKNFLQTMLDIHLTIDWVNSIKRNSAPSSVSLLGLSMGSFLGLLYEGVEPNRVTGGDAFYAAGGDVSRAGLTYAGIYKDDYFSKMVLSEGWTADKGRKTWGQIDTLTWSGQIKNRTMLLMNAQRDEVFLKKFSFDPLFSILNPNNKLKIDWTSTMHDPSRGTNILYQATHVFWPIMDYVRFNGFAADPDKCGGGPQRPR